MHMRRFTRLTNGFSKKVEVTPMRLPCASCTTFFVRIHATLRMIPAMAAGVPDKLWEIGDIVPLIEAKEAEKLIVRGPYKKRTAI